MDAELRKLQRLYEQDPTEENRRKYRKALIRNGIETPPEVGDIVWVQEFPGDCIVYLESPWIGVVVQVALETPDGPDKEFIRVKFLSSPEEIRLGLFRNLWTLEDLAQDGGWLKLSRDIVRVLEPG